VHLETTSSFSACRPLIARPVRFVSNFAVVHHSNGRKDHGIMQLSWLCRTPPQAAIEPVAQEIN
jgi:hypothetical protein